MSQKKLLFLTQLSQKKQLFLTQLERGLDQVSQKKQLFLTPRDRGLRQSILAVVEIHFWGDVGQKDGLR